MLRNTTHKQYLHGDFDMDGTPNIDDSRPYDASVSKRVETTSLSRELRMLDRQKKPYRRAYENVISFIRNSPYANRIRHGHLKGNRSIINKLRGKYFHNLKDIARLTILVRNSDEAYNIKGFLSQKYSIIEEHDYFSRPKSDGYKALHLIVDVSGLPVEVQLKEHRIHKSFHHPQMHALYKLQKHG